MNNLFSGFNGRTVLRVLLTDTLMVILNKNNSPVTLQLDRFKSMLGESAEGKEIITGKTISLEDALHLEKAGPMIIEIKK